MESVAQEKIKRSVGGKLFNFRPALFFALFFALGVWSVYRFQTDGNFLFTVGVSLLLIPLVLLLSNKKSFVAGIFLLVSFALGIFSSFSQIERYENPYAAGRYEATGKIVDGDERGGLLSFTVDSLTIDGKNTDGLMVVYLEKEWADKLEIGDKIIFTAEITPCEIDKDAFAYGLIADGVRFYANGVTDFARLPSSPDIFTRLRLILKQRLYGGMSSESAAFTAAVLTGDTSGIDGGILDNVRFSGVAHIFAVSGLHIGALYAFCRLLTDKTGLKRLPKTCKFLFVAFILIFYGGICRYTASVVRAITMCLISYLTGMLGVKSDSIERIGVAMLVCLLLSPASLFTAGFLLSFGACFGICVFYRTLFDCFAAWVGKKRKDNNHGLCGFFAAMLSAQIFTAPICLYFFGYISVWGFLLNCVFVPLLSAVFSIFLAVGWICCLLPVAWANAILSVPSTAISGLLLLFHAVDFSFVLFSGVSVPNTGLFLYYTGIAFSSDKINAKRGIKIATAAAFAIIFVWVMVAANI